MRIAKHTWIGCAAGKIFFNKIVDHKTTKLFADIKNKMSKAMLQRPPCGHH